MKEDITDPYVNKLISMFDEDSHNMRYQRMVEEMSFNKVDQYTRGEPKIHRNDPCPCESGKKYKKCCIK